MAMESVYLLMLSQMDSHRRSFFEEIVEATKTLLDLGLFHHEILNIVGARPNFMKIAPLMDELIGNESFKAVLVHTGQHYDAKMSGLFF